MKPSVIEHSARVLSVEAGRVVAEVTAESACVSCKARSACGMGESSRKVVMVETPDAPAYAPGEEVILSVGRQTGMRAVLWAYCIPFLVLLAVLVCVTAAGGSQGVAALASLGAVAIYYLLLALAREKFKKNIIFKIRKL